MTDEPFSFDRACRRAARDLDDVGFLNWVLPRVGGVYRFTGWLPERRLPLPGQPGHTCDTLAGWEARAGDRAPLATVIEFQTRPEARFLLRLANYAIDVELEEPYQKEHPRVDYSVQGVVVLLTGTMPDRLSEDFTGVGLGRREWTFRVLRLAEESAADALERVAAGALARCVLPWVPLMSGGDEPAVITRWMELAGGEPNAVRRGDYAALAVALAEAADRTPVWTAALEGWNVEESKVLRKLFERITKAEIAEAKERGLAEGEARGRAEGEARGRAEGEARVRQELCEKLELVVGRLYGGAALDEVRPALERADRATLSAWFDLAFTLTWDDFRSRVAD